MSKATNKFAPEIRTRAVRMVLDHEGDHSSRWPAIVSIAEKIGYVPQTLFEWVKKAEDDSGRRAGVPTEMADRLKALERENRELRQANDPAQDVGVFCPGGASQRTLAPVQTMTAFIDAHRDEYGIEPICRVLPIATSTYRARVAQLGDRNAGRTHHALHYATTSASHGGALRRHGASSPGTTAPIREQDRAREAPSRAGLRAPGLHGCPARSSWRRCRA